MSAVLQKYQFDTLRAVSVRREGRPGLWTPAQVLEHFIANGGDSNTTQNAVEARLRRLENRGLVRRIYARKGPAMWQITKYGKQELGDERRRRPGVQS